MLTVAYCRVSTDEQAADGFSIEGQAEKLRAYAGLRDLGDVTVITDPGCSGKDMNRPGLQQLLYMVDQEHVAAVLVWRLDRLSRDLGDLVLLADTFLKAEVGLHSFTENLDLSSATGRMYYNVLGSFAQFYREQLAENVRMGMAQAMRDRRWLNRPPTGYDLKDGLLTPNDMAAVVRRVFVLRSEGHSQAGVAEATGVKHSTVLAILKNRAYLGEIRHREDWLPGIHEALVSEDLWDAAHKGRVPGRRRGKDLLSGRVTCGLCGRRMSIDSNGQGQAHYRCRHRGEGCQQPARSNLGLLRAAILGMHLLGEDVQLQESIRRQLEAVRRQPGHGRPRTAPASVDEPDKLHEQRKKLLRLHYEDRISAEQFGEEQARLTLLIASHQDETNRRIEEQLQADRVLERFEGVTSLLQGLDIDEFWGEATEVERRALVDELVEMVVVHPDHLEVAIAGAPKVNVLLNEVGLKDSGNARVGGGT
jgi:site-specific DNA recombinase